MSDVYFRNLGTRICIGATLLWLWAGACAAQTTGTLIGTTRLADGSPLPGVQVRAESPNLQGVRNTTSRRGGVYRFAFLPAGNYTITAAAEGMKTSQHEIVIGLSQVFQLELVMEPAPSQETIEVRADVAATVTTTQVTANYTNDFIDKLPQARGLDGIALLAPGTTNFAPDERLTISGGPSFDNLYLVNGSVANFDNVSGRATNLLIEDALQELTVLSGSVSAEFGYFSGGVVNAVTRSGGNDFEGTLRFQFFNDDWRARTPFQKETGFEREDDLSDLASAVVGGPILKDRLWFFVAARNERNNEDIELPGPMGLDPLLRQMLGIPPASDPPGTRSQDADLTDERYEVKLTAAFSERHNATLSYMKREDEQENGFDAPFRPIHESALLDSLRTEESLLSLNYRFQVSDALAFEAVFSDKQSEIAGAYSEFPISDPSRRAAVTPFIDQLGGFGLVNAPFLVGDRPDERDNRAFRFKAGYLWLPQTTGIHNLSFGYQHFADSRTSDNTETATGWLFIGISDWDADGNPIPVVAPAYPLPFLRPATLQYSFVETPALGTDFEIQSWYVNDEWVLNDYWQLNLGLRYDANRAKDNDGTTVSKDDALSPRVSARYQWQQGENKHQVEASYANYVARLSDVANSGAAGGQLSSFRYTYTGPTTTSLDEVYAWIDEHIGPDPTNPISVQPTSVSRVNAAGLRVADDLKSPSSREWRLGYTLSRDARRYVKIDYLNRTFEDYYATFINLDLGRTANGESDITLIDNDPGFYQRDYDAIQLQMSWPLAEQVQSGASYTWSQLIGNQEQETTSGAVPPDGLTTYPEYVVPEFQPIASMSGDLRHNLKFWLSYNRPVAGGLLNLSLLQQVQSARPYGSSAQVTLGDRSFGFPENPGYQNVDFIRRNYFLEPIGTHETDALLQTDLAVNYDLPLGKVDLFVRIDIFNIFNQDALVNPNGINRTVNITNAFNVFNETPVEGVHWVRSPNFGQANSSAGYQSPREFRFDLGLRF
ncbi:TonB-dependent receptor [Acanthopleuribacter pedis]|uniref:TonB-dependent receptor n=1 Tax=Acanthopleuribacter pedis TaxID=442870 RepID=A0A8J7QIT2_9BACT|nr:TonB-dependent receptor [Acanthopleuribacter pedis]MBO1318970.1 TonB-dependent receptor [Acanthopleuribacter pedis]